MSYTLSQGFDDGTGAKQDSLCTADYLQIPGKFLILLSNSKMVARHHKTLKRQNYRLILKQLKGENHCLYLSAKKPLFDHINNIIHHSSHITSF